MTQLFNLNIAGSLRSRVEKKFISDHKGTYEYEYSNQFVEEFYGTDSGGDGSGFVFELLANHWLQSQ